ncbi:MAG: apolipoprotein N-acyltransferase [bacterium]
MDKWFTTNEWVWLIFSAAILALGYPPLPLGFFAHFALVPILFIVEKKGLKETFKIGFFWGLLSSLFLLHWISYVTVIGTVLACFILALYPAFILWLYRLLAIKISKIVAYALFPFLWVGMEFIRGWGELGFPWADLAHTQIKYPVFTQFAELTGSRGISFWVVILNLFFFGLVRNIKQKSRFIFIFIIIVAYTIPFIYGVKELKRKWRPKDEFRVALLQGNIDPRKKWDESFQWENFESYLQMVSEIGDKVSLVIWPETATANYLRRELRFTTKLVSLIDSVGVPNLVGSLDYEYINGELHEYNSAVLIYPGGEWVWYAKNHLVPFSEHFPFDQYVPILRKLNKAVEIGQGEFTPGKTKTIMRVDKKIFGTIICFESIFQELVRDFVLKGAEFLVVITNDGWFGKSAGPYQHKEIAKLRAIENRIYIARCANTGISCIIDPTGKEIAQIPLNKKGYLIGSLGLKRETTFFTRHGDIISRLSFGVISAALLWIIIKHFIG